MALLHRRESAIVSSRSYKPRAIIPIKVLTEILHLGFGAPDQDASVVCAVPYIPCDKDGLRGIRHAPREDEMWAADEPGPPVVEVSNPNELCEAPTLATLLEHVAAGDHHAFELIYNDWQPKLYAVAFRILRNPADAADAVHEGLLQVWQNAHRYDPAAGSAKSWIYAIVRYRSLEILSRRLQQIEDGALDEIEDSGASPLDQIESKSMVQHLGKQLRGLDPTILQILDFAFYKDMSYIQVAVHIGKPIGTVKAQIRRTFRRLRQQLDG